MIIGIDPGLDGAVAVLRPDDSVTFHDTPTVTVQGSKRKQRQYLADVMVEIFEEGRQARSRGDRVTVVLERQQAMPATLNGRSQGTTSSFSTGFGYGLWYGIVVALRLPLEIVHPATWKRQMLKDGPTGKEASIMRAIRLSPNAAGELKRKKDHGRAEALLLCHYAQRFLLGTVKTKEF